MNEFVEQFLIECRELVEQATDDLLTLEGQPDDKDRLDSAFRAFHTLKGAAGIVDFDAMGRALHAAEDVLSDVRAGREPVTPQLISNGLTCLDQVVQWLDAMEVDGEIPPGADAAADAIVRRFDGDGQPAAPPPAPSTGQNWIQALLDRHGPATLALRYAPDPDAFFRGEDPLALLAGLPNLIAVEILNAGDLPPLAELDPFRCHLVLGALTAGDAASAAAMLESVMERVEIVAIGRETAPNLPHSASALLEAQLMLLAEPAAEGLAGRLAAAGRASGNVLRHLGRTAEAARLDAIAAGALAALDPSALATAIRTVSRGPLEGPEAPVADALPAEAAARTLRVDVERIDALVNLTGELLVAKNALGHAAALAAEGAPVAELASQLKAQQAVLGRLVDELQRSVLSIRVLPMRYVFQRFPRLVREMMAALGKPAQLVTEGDETEADKVIVESLFEPLLHVLRNALDHGVESPTARAAAGKPASAVIRLAASRQGEHVVIEVSDDGGGVDVDRVRAVAQQRGVASGEALEAMDEQDIVDLIFAPGFSTSTQVTSLSGRGVGMDAVRAAVERLGGRVRIDSRRGAGTTIRFDLPFAVMMSRVLTVEAGGQMFGIPLESVVETVRVDRERMAPIGAARAFVLRNRTIPVIDLAQALGAREQRKPAGPASIVVASAGGQLGGLEVDRLGERLDVMLKPMEGLLSGMPGVAGTTLLGDGRVLIVLDLQAVLQ